MFILEVLQLAKLNLTFNMKLILCDLLESFAKLFPFADSRDLGKVLESSWDIGELLFTICALILTHVRLKAYCLDYQWLKCELINVLMP